MPLSRRSYRTFPSYSLRSGDLLWQVVDIVRNRIRGRKNGWEVGIKRRNADKSLLLERQIYWPSLLNGNEYTIPKWQVLLVEALRSGMAA